MKRRNRMLALLLSLSMVAPWITPAHAASTDEVIFEQVDNEEVKASLMEDVVVPDQPEAYSDDEKVRVSIVIEGDSTIEKGHDTRGIADNQAAGKYRQQVLERQEAVINAIEQEIGEQLDVEWNLTLIANIVSANVEYGQIEVIEKVKGVKLVQIENQYQPDVVEELENTQPNMYFAGGMTNLSDTWANGYTGAGTRIAIVDTGTDTDHQSFSNEAYIHALEENAAAKDMSYDEYVKSLDLLDAEEIEACLTQLNAYAKGAKKAKDLYINSKLPFGYSYVDADLDVTHDNDGAGNHGSHVAGISAANRYVESNGEMKPALDTVMVAGAAPDAQILTMKVFGNNGGAYDSDFFAAIEDAIILGADTVNLSLGSANPGTTMAGAYQQIMENMKNTSTTVVLSAGNASQWSYYGDTGAYLDGPYLYASDIALDTVGMPGSYTNSLTVASVENCGNIVEGSLQLSGNLIRFNVGQSPQPIDSIPSMDISLDGSGTEFEYILVDTYGEEGDFDNLLEEIEGKILFVSRGLGINFGVKANRAVEAGAIATIIYNNVSGSVNMNLEGYEYTKPCVSISKEDAQKFRDEGQVHTDSDGESYYTGKLTIAAGLQKVAIDDEYISMSAFSSWGVTGDLALKPEIAAPGGNIYSVSGGSEETDNYVNMSGTSMAAPHAAGVGALIQEYIQDKNLTGYFADPIRGLVQSLMMSTATPMVDSQGRYYPVMQQGAGLINAAAATSADSYIRMNKNATVSYDDGKVKAELGDDPDRKGVYSFDFEIRNLTDAEKVYDLRADVFTQNSVEGLTMEGSDDTTLYMDTATIKLDAATVFMVGGEEVQQVTLPGKGTAKIKVTITLSESAKEDFLDRYFEKGAYIQAYVFADAVASEEGVVYTSHSIPVLAFYGNWTDATMFYGVSSQDGEFLTSYSTNQMSDFSRTAYFAFSLDGVTPYESNNCFVVNNNGKTYNLGGNPVIADDCYQPERNAVAGQVEVPLATFHLIRNSSQNTVSIENLDSGEQYYYAGSDGDVISAYSNTVGSDIGFAYYEPNATIKGAAEGERIEFKAVFLPEYYDEGKLGYGNNHGEGAVASVTAVVDNTMPGVNEIRLEGDTLVVDAADNQYIAAVVLYNDAGNRIISYEGAKAEINPGEDALFHLELDDSDEEYFLIQVFDYALNMATYRVIVDGNEFDYSGAMIAFNQDDPNWVLTSRTTEEVKPIAQTENVFNAATSVSGTIFAVTDDGRLFVLEAENLKDEIFVASLDYTFVDMAFNPNDGWIYAVTDANEMIRLDVEDGTCTKIGTMPMETNTLACGDDGVFYSNRYGTGEIYSYTLDAVNVNTSLNHDFNGDNTINAADAQMLMNYVVGAEETIHNKEYADVDGDGDVDTYDVYLMQENLQDYPKLLAIAHNTRSKYLQAMEVDHNSGKLLWASYFIDYMQGDAIGFSYLWEIDPENGEITRHYDVWDELTALAILDMDSSSVIPPANDVIEIRISAKDKKMEQGASVTLDAGVSPWNVDNKKIVWSSSDPSVATVDKNGVVTAVSDGSCVITATSAMDPSVKTQCNIVVGNGKEKQKQVSAFETAWNAAAYVNNSEKGNYVSDEEIFKTVTFSVLAKEQETNALIRFSYNSDDLDLIGVSAKGLLGYFADGNQLTVGYASAEENVAGTETVKLTFQMVPCSEDQDIMIRQLERNNTHLNEESAAALSCHNWGQWSIELEPNCTDDGEQIRVCTDCDAEQVRVLPASGEHVWSDWEVTKEATCTQKGEESRYCEECFEEETRETNATGVHQWSDWEEVEAATCTAEGQKLRSCESCGAEETEVIPATGAHSWGEWTVRTQATETEEGLEYRTCTVCKQEQTKAIPATGEHNWSEWEEVKAESCLTEGQEQRKCADCGEVQTRVIPAIGGHSWGEWTVTTQPGEETVGEESRQCDVCGETEMKEIPATGHICPSKNFSDLDTGRWYHEGVDYVLNQGYMKGMSDTAFAPDGALTRGQLVTILYRVEGMPSVSGQDNPFTDVAAGRYYTDAIIWAASEGVVKGVGDGLFVPDQEITREQIATILYRFDGAQKVEEDHLSKFSDVAKISNFAKEAMNWAVSEELIKGMGDGTVSPKTSATRAQIATILMRYLSK